MLAPAALGMFADGNSLSEAEVLGLFGRRWLLLKTRKRITKDGEVLILVVDN